MSSRIHVDSEAIIQSTEQIRNSIEETEKLAQDIGNALDSNSGAYAEGDIDEKEIRHCIEEIQRTIAESAQTIANSISKLREFAQEMDSIG